jgi:hypothetical protein
MTTACRILITGAGGLLAAMLRNRCCGRVIKFARWRGVAGVGLGEAVSGDEPVAVGFQRLQQTSLRH